MREVVTSCYPRSEQTHYGGGEDKDGHRAQRLGRCVREYGAGAALEGLGWAVGVHHSARCRQLPGRTAVRLKVCASIDHAPLANDYCLYPSQIVLREVLSIGRLSRSEKERR